MSLNQAAFPLAESLVGRADDCGVTWHETAGVRIADCGVRASGSVEAGLVMAQAALAGLGTVRLTAAGPGAFGPAWPDCPWPVVSVGSDAPVAACLAAQYAGWKVHAGDYFAMASGPIRAAIGREDLFAVIGLRERSAVAVGILEAARLPPEDVCRQLAADAGVPPAAVILLVARTASPAGTLQVVARSLETAIHKLHDLRFDLGRIRRGRGLAPLPPVPFTPSAAGPKPDDLAAIGRTNDAILYGGHVTLEVEGPEADLLAIGPRMVSAASPAFGEPFLRLFERAGSDFYAIDPAVFAPAVVDLVSTATGRTHRFGRIVPEIVARSFGPTAAPFAAAGG
jgi:methenyltetrahydromethanopterin cyclohydrolase